MEWQGQEESSNIEDDRGAGGGGGGFGGFGGFGGYGPHVAVGGGGFGLIIAIALISWAITGDPFRLLQGGGGGGPPGQQQPLGPPGPRPPGEERLKEFVAVVLKSTENVWTDLFRQEGRVYKDPKLHLFTGRVNSACGLTSAAVGPFYCPADEKVYLDLDFFQELHTRFGARGEFPQAYVVAHEVGHHVQKLLGITDRVDAQRSRLSKVQANHLSVRLELQADFFAGVWAHYSQKQFKLNAEDIQEAIECAQAIGDDRLQKQAQGVVIPDSFTHGTAAQRSRWFTRGFETGDMSKGDTFSTDEL